MRVALAILLGVAVPAMASETTTFTYDALGRLQSSANSGGPRDTKTNAVQYDAAGNRSAVAVGQPLPAPVNNSVFSVSGPASVTEGATATFTIARSGQAAGPLTVNYAATNGTASAPGDFVPTSGTMTFRAWETIRTISVSVLDDGVTEGAEQFSMALSSPSAGAVLGTGSASVTISGPGNQPPVANADTGSMGTCAKKVFNVLANDTDPEGNTPLVIVSASTDGSYGTVTLSGSTSVRFSAFGSTGVAQVSYVVRDSLGATATGQLNVTIQDLGGCN